MPAAWSQFDMDWEGVSMLTLIDIVQPKPEARHVFYKSRRLFHQHHAGRRAG